MKKNLISAIAGWKSAALLALIAMVAAVAFSGVLTSSPVSADEHPTLTLSELTLSGTNISGEVTLENLPMDDSDPPVPEDWSFQVEDSAGDDVGACSTVNSSHADGQDLPSGIDVGNAYEVLAYGSDDCSGDSIADVALSTPALTDATETQTANPGGHIDVSFAITATPARATLVLTSDGAEGTFAATGAAALTCQDNNSCDRSDKVSGLVTIRVNVGEDSKKGQTLYLAGTAADTAITINIEDPAPKAATFSVAPAKGQETAAADTGESTIVVTVKDDTTPVADSFTGAIDITFITANGQLICGTQDPQPSCTVAGELGDDGQASATITGGTPGTATITVVAGKLGAKSTEVTFFGEATSLEASVAEGSINQGDSTFVTFTVQDADGRPVKGAEVDQPAAAADKVTAPDVEDAVGVTVALAQDDDDDTDDAPPKDSMYCADGTNAAGQCVARIDSAVGAAATTRGEHAAHFQLVVDATDPDKTLTADAVVRVVGSAHDIETDAPETVEPRTRVTINISVYDDEGNLVGGGDVTVVKLEGRGAVLGTTDGKAALTGGEASVQYYATSTDEAVVLEFTIGTGDDEVTEIVEIVVAEPVVEAEPEPEPEPEPAPTWSVPLAEGWNLVAWLGEDMDVGDAVGDANATAVYAWSQAAGWTFWFSDSASGVSTDTLSRVSTNQSYFVYVAAAAAEESAE